MERIDRKEKFLKKGEFVSSARLVRKKFSHPALFKHEGYEVVAVFDGECFEQVENRRYRLAKGDLLFIAEGEYHAMTVPARIDFGFLNIRPHGLFSHPEAVKKLLTPFLLGAGGGKHKITGNSGLFRETRKLMEQVENNPRALQPRLSAVVAWMKAFEKLPKARQEKKWGARTDIQPALDLIYRFFGNPLTAEDLSKACAMSKMTFYRRFFSVYRKNPKNFLNEVRLLRAFNSLTTTDQKISVIALESGFGNLSNFNRAFLRKYGKSPREYRRKKS